jgi:hypothetical protein
LAGVLISTAIIKNSKDVPQKFKIELPAISLLDPTPKEMKVIYQGDTCSSLFIVMLFTIAKKWRQPKYASTDEWSEKCTGWIVVQP